MSTRAMARWGASRLVVAFLATGLFACAGKSPETFVASAKTYLKSGQRAAATIQLNNALQIQPDFGEARYLLGKLLFNEGNAAASAIELRKAQQLQYLQDDVVPLLAKALLGSGEARKAIELDQSVTLKAPEAVADLKTTVAIARALNGEKELAREDLAAALRAQPDWAPALLLRANELASERQWDEATKIVDAVIARTPDAADALVFKADLLRHAGKGTASVAQLYRQALMAQPGHLPAFEGLVDLLLSEKDLDGARGEIESMEKLRPGQAQVAYFRARLLAQQGDLNTANRLLQQLLVTAPDNAQYLELAGWVALRRNELVVAEEHLGKVVKAGPPTPVARQLLAQALLRSGEPAKAIDMLRPLLDSAAPDARTTSIAAGAHLVLGELKAAEALYKRNAEADATDTHSRTGVAVALVLGGSAAIGLNTLESVAAAEAGTEADLTLVSASVARRDYARALKAIDRFEKKTPGQPQGSHLRGQVLALQGDIDGARASFEKALRADANYYPSIDGLAALDLRERHPAAARARFEAVRVAHPDDVRPVVALAKLDELAGEPKAKVAATFLKAVAMRPEDPSLRRDLVRYHLGKHDYALAVGAAQDAVAALPNDPDMLALLAAAQLAAGDANQAISAYGKLVSLQPGSVAALLGLARAQIADKAYAAAAESVNKAGALAPDSVAVVEVGAQIDVLAGRFDAALGKAQAMETRLPKSPAGFAIEGDLEFARQNAVAAARAYRAALQRDAASSALAQNLFRALHASGDLAKSEAFATEWVQGHQADAPFLFFHAVQAIADRKYEFAEGRLEQVLRLDPDNAMAMNNLAWVLSAQKKAQALEYAEKANLLSPNQPVMMDTLAKVLAERGQLPRALQVEKKALELDPGADDLRLALARLYVQGGDKAAAREQLDVLAKLGDKFPRQGEVRDLRVRL